MGLTAIKISANRSQRDLAQLMRLSVRWLAM
jgi:hypothetical protein